MIIVVKLLKKFWKDLLIILMAVALFSSVRSCNVNKDTIAVLKHSKDSAFTVAQNLINEKGELIARVNTQEVTIGQLKDNGSSLGIENGSLKKHIGNLNRLVAYWKGQARIERTDTVVIPLHDTVFQDRPFQSFQFEDTYIKAKGMIDVLNKTVTMSYTLGIDLNFELIGYYKGKNFFKQGQLVTDFKFDQETSKYLRVGEFSGVVIKQPPKKWWETRGAAFGAGIITGMWLNRR